MSNISFDATTVPPQASFTPIPAGVYEVAITDSEVKPTKSGGQMAVFTLQVTDGQHAGRKVFARFNVQNANPEAERIGKSQLSALCHAAGVLQLQDTAQLHGHVVRARVKVRVDPTGQYEPSNEVSGFESANAAALSAVGQPRAAASAPARDAAPASTPPWAKKVA